VFHASIHTNKEKKRLVTEQILERTVISFPFVTSLHKTGRLTQQQQKRTLQNSNTNTNFL